MCFVIVVCAHKHTISILTLLLKIALCSGVSPDLFNKFTLEPKKNEERNFSDKQTEKTTFVTKQEKKKNSKMFKNTNLTSLFVSLN